MSRRTSSAARRALRPGTLRRWIALAAVALLLACALLTGVLRAGGRYFYCEAMGVMLTDPCMTASNAPSDLDEDALRDQPVDCCKVGTLPAMPDGASAMRVTVAPAPWLSTVPALDLRSSFSTRTTSAFGHAAGQSRAPPRPPGELRAQLMVFLT